MYSIEKINQNKIVGILLSFTGVLIITKIDTSSNNPSDSNTAILAGNLLALLGALIYGIYTILLKFKITIKNSIRERNLDTHLFFGFVGVFNTFLLWPIIIILHFTDIERFELPSNNRTISLLLTNALITFVSDFCWCKAVLLTSPLTVTVGLSMTIPLAMVGDWILKGFSVNWWYLFGAFIVTVGFLVINKDEKDDFVTNRETHEEIQ
jgi:solute carrier family 35 protein F5